MGMVSIGSSNTNHISHASIFTIELLTLMDELLTFITVLFRGATDEGNILLSFDEKSVDISFRRV